ncbi:MAG: hypothetical protein ACYC6P_04255 [Ignavibacteriaceae bacterium]
MEQSEHSNEAEWSDERRGHCCIEMPNRDDDVCGFFIAVQFLLQQNWINGN